MYGGVTLLGLVTQGTAGLSPGLDRLVGHHVVCQCGGPIIGRVGVL
jgi:hypothetical protein